MVNGKSIVELVTMELWDLLPCIRTLAGPIAQAITPYIERVLQCLIDSEVGYLTLSRSVATLSSGESQRIKLARQLGSALIELIYVLDEPTAGLHARDVEHLIGVLRQLVAKPNTVIVVEHDKSVMLGADHLVDMGPGAGVYGGQVIAQGSPEAIMRSGTPTGQYLSGAARLRVRHTRYAAQEYLEIRRAQLHNLKGIDIHIPRNVLTCITGVSGSGKSSLVEVLLKQHPEIVVVDQSPVGATPRSNPATYVKVFDEIRAVFAQVTGQSKSLFTFNGAGACPACKGLGYCIIDMHFLGDVRQVCEECQGRRYTAETLRHTYRGKSIAEVLALTVEEAQAFFEQQGIQSKLRLLTEVGLGYLRLGQPLDTLSGGEAQRVKLASRLGLPGEVYVLDEPTRGLHFADIDHLLGVLDQLVEQGNTVIVVEHNLDVIRNADWVIDLGPEGGKRGGEIVAEGPPEMIAQSPRSFTGKYLAEVLGQNEGTK
jgi:excinuclease UvrABC ATPase subunit